MKAVWRGYIILGQLGIPARLYTATQSIRPKFSQLHEKDSAPVERVLKCSKEDKEIRYDEIIRAVEYSGGHYVTVTDNELEQAVSQSVKTVDIKQFCIPDEVDARHYEKPFYVVPAKGGERAYALLREVLARTQKLAVGQFAIHGNEHVAVLAAQEDMVILHQLRYAAELIPRSAVPTPSLPKPSPSEIEALEAVVNRYSGPLYLRDYHDEFSERLQQLIERKARGLPVPRPERPDAHATPEDDIITVLSDTLAGRQRLAINQKS